MIPLAFKGNRVEVDTEKGGKGIFCGGTLKDLVK